MAPLRSTKKLPKIKSRKFNTYEEFNTWKQELLDRIAAEAEETWTP